MIDDSDHNSRCNMCLLLLSTHLIGGVFLLLGAHRFLTGLIHEIFDTDGFNPSSLHFKKHDEPLHDTMTSSRTNLKADLTGPQLNFNLNSAYGSFYRGHMTS